MTKHLRLIMLSLLAMICLGGYSQSKGPEVTLDFSDYKGNPWKIPTSYCKETKTLTYGTYKIILTPGESKGFMLNNYKGTGVLQMGNENASITLPAFNFDVEKIVVVTPSGVGNTKVTQNVYVDEVAVSTQTTGCQSNKEYQIKEEYQKSENRYVIKVTNGYLTYMSKIQIYKKQGSGKTATTLSFKDLVGKGVTLINGKLENGNDFKGYTATEKDNVAGTITYAASGAGVATVDANTGAVIVNPNVYGTTTITATFTPDETKTYAMSRASYTVINKDPNAVDVVFVAGVDKGTTTDTSADGMSKGEVTIASSSAALGNSTDYRFYAGSTTTFSVKTGKIVKIEFVGDKDKIRDNYLNNLSLLEGEPGTLVTDKYEATWTGEASSIKFKPSKQARATKITITVVGAIFLDENGDNNVEAAENVNVTLKRTFYKDGEWNTLCLPFAVADAKTAFDGAELREVDTEKSNGNTIVFKKATAIEAGKPYLIKWANTSTEAVDFEKKFEGVTLVAAATPVEVNNGGISFNGFYKMTEARELGASVAAIGAGNKLFKVTKGKMKGFRAAFVLPSGVQQAAINVVIDGTATGIEDLVVDGVKANGRVYNLNGQYVGNSLNGLQPGIYIQNGKKVVVK